MRRNDGTARRNDGTARRNDGTARHSDGTLRYCDGTTRCFDGTTCRSDGNYRYRNGPSQGDCSTLGSRYDSTTARARIPILIGTSFPSTYEVFNYLECAAWFIIALGLPFWFRKCPADKRRVIIRASFTLIVFGISDYVEAPTHGRLPPWLWAWKLGCAAYLLKCRYDYIGRERFRWFDRTNVLAMACFLAVLLAMFLQFYFRDLLAESE